MNYKTFFYIYLFTISIFPQSNNPESILTAVKAEFEKIEDYTVDVRIKVDVDFLKMPDREATIFFKKPDKFHIESEGFAILPKEGLNFSPLGLLNSEYTSFYEREDTVKGIITSVIKVLPLDPRSDVILSTFWIDTRRNLVMRIESSRKPQGSFIIELDYKKSDKGFWLPSSMAFNFSIDRTLFSKRFNPDTESESGKVLKDSTKSEIGSVYLNYSNYKVNTGLPDSLFENKGATK